eukprot:16445570-Heterocapsa_arctica.AAC.1
MVQIWPWKLAEFIVNGVANLLRNHWSKHPRRKPRLSAFPVMGNGAAAHAPPAEGPTCRACKRRMPWRCERASARSGGA